MTTQGTPVTFFYKTMLGSTGSTLLATSTATGDYAVTNIYNWFETNTWKASSTVAQNITFDTTNSTGADYFAMAGHNIGTLGATITLKTSTSGAWAGEEVMVFSTTVPNDNLFLKEFSNPGNIAHWRLSLSTYASTVAPYMAVAVWGEKTVMSGGNSFDGYIQGSFDPYGQTRHSNVNMTQNGYMAGIHNKYTERMFSLSFLNASTATYTKVKTWWENHGLKNFIVAWDSTGHSTDIFLMRAADGGFVNPININKYRDITINLTGRKE